MKRLLDWSDQRTGWRKLSHEALYENVPGGSRWRYVWGSTLVFCLAVQVITGIFLWMAYSPSSRTAWESVHFIQNEMAGGWLLRGLHHYTAQIMTILLVLHLMQVVIDGAYKAPREVNFWTGLIMLQLVLGLSLTGYLLPWDQKGFWATKVATNLVAPIPLIGPGLQKLIIGGPDYGHHTLTRFFALHAGVLPGAIILLTVGHVALFRKHGLKAKEPKRKPDVPFWPDQVLKDAVACLAVLVVVLFLIVRHRMFGGHGPLGAELGAPADPSENFSAARPEWYFLFLFQFLKYFPGKWEILGSLIIPGLLFGVIALMPFIGKWRLGHRFNVGFLFTLIIGAALLTAVAVRVDSANPVYIAAVKKAEREAERVKELASAPTGIPVSGAVTLLRNDPLLRGPELFSKHCSSCHRYGGHDGMGVIPKDAQSASDLKGFASREWLTGFLNPERIDTTNYFGATAFKNGEMSKALRRRLNEVTPEVRANLPKVVAALSAEAGLKSQKGVDAADQAMIEAGRESLRKEFNCIKCHQFREVDKGASAPDLTGYGSREWLIAFISDPAHERFYHDNNDRMPSFAKDNNLSEDKIQVLADWLRGDWYEAKKTEAEMK